MWQVHGLGSLTSYINSFATSLSLRCLWLNCHPSFHNTVIAFIYFSLSHMCPLMHGCCILPLWQNTETVSEEGKQRADLRRRADHHYPLWPLPCSATPASSFSVSPLSAPGIWDGARNKSPFWSEELTAGNKKKGRARESSCEKHRWLFGVDSTCPRREAISGQECWITHNKGIRRNVALCADPPSGLETENLVWKAAFRLVSRLLL